MTSTTDVYVPLYPIINPSYYDIMLYTILNGHVTVHCGEMQTIFFFATQPRAAKMEDGGAVQPFSLPFSRFLDDDAGQPSDVETMKRVRLILVERGWTEEQMGVFVPSMRMLASYLHDIDEICATMLALRAGSSPLAKSEPYLRSNESAYESLSQPYLEARESAYTSFLDDLERRRAAGQDDNYVLPSGWRRDGIGGGR